MKNTELNYAELACKLLEGICGITLELFDARLKHGEMDIQDEVGLPIEMLKEMWACHYVSEKTGISEETLTKLSKEVEKYL